jgi:protoporphyrinogen/coproporphyrinogen III oxidase
MTGFAGRKSAAVVGAGFSGLVTAYYLERAGFSVDLYERQAKVGGLLGTNETEYGIAESAANAFLNSHRLEELFRDLGLRMIRTNPEARARFIFRGGKLRKWPLGFSATLAFIRFIFRFLFNRKAVLPKEGESVGAWGTRVMNAEVAENLLLPAFQGIYAGEGSRLSAKLLLSGLFRKTAERKPLVRGSVSAERGMGEFTEALAEKLKSRGVRFHFGTSAPTRFPADVVYYCGSAYETATAIENAAPGLAHLLSRIEMLPLVSVTTFFKKNPKTLPGFGVLFPPREEFQSLGVLYNHFIFPNRVKAADVQSETWIFGGARNPGIVEASDDQILRQIISDRSRIQDKAEEYPLHFVVQRWRKAIPYYTVDFESVLEEILERNAESIRVRAMGNYLGGIGLAKILDRAAESVDDLCKKMGQDGK